MSHKCNDNNVKTNLVQIDYIDVTFNLKDGMYHPFKNLAMNKSISIFHETIHHKKKKKIKMKNKIN